MKIYDISQEVFSCQVYPGDPAPERKVLGSMSEGELYNLTAFSMCAHNGTHVDAPFHFLKDGKTVDTICLEAFIGMAIPINASRQMVSTVFPSFRKWKGASTCVPLCAHILNAVRLYSSPSDIEPSTFLSGAGSPGYT